MSTPTVPELIGMLLFCGTDGCMASAISMLRDATYKLLEALTQRPHHLAMSRNDESLRAVDRRLVGLAVAQVQQDIAPYLT